MISGVEEMNVSVLSGPAKGLFSALEINKNGTPSPRKDSSEDEYIPQQTNDNASTSLASLEANKNGVPNQRKFNTNTQVLPPQRSSAESGGSLAALEANKNGTPNQRKFNANTQVLASQRTSAESSTALAAPEANKNSAPSRMVKANTISFPMQKSLLPQADLFTVDDEKESNTKSDNKRASNAKISF